MSELKCEWSWRTPKKVSREASFDFGITPIKSHYDYTSLIEKLQLLHLVVLLSSVGWLAKNGPFPKLTMDGDRDLDFK